MRHATPVISMGCTGRRALAAFKSIAEGGGLADTIATAEGAGVPVGKALVQAENFPDPVPDGDWPAVAAAFARLGAIPPASGEIGACCRGLVEALTRRASLGSAWPHLSPDQAVAS
jgi:hypothetical protein